MTPEKEDVRDSIVYEAFHRHEHDPEGRIELARKRCGDDAELFRAVQSELEAEDEVRRRAFLEGIEGSARDSALPKGAQVGEYVIGMLIGSGGMGAVYQAEQPRLQRLVAVKFLQTRLAPNARERFLSEARALSAVHSEHVVHIYNYDEFRGQPYIVMEYVRGTNLLDAIRDGSCGDISSRLRIGRQIAEGLEDIHQAGLAHRDVKPSNVLIQPSGKIKLLDFGIAWREDSRLTQVGQVMGTPAYMAPEQVLRSLSVPSGQESKQYKQVDIYSFGILLYELLTGQLPFDGETRGEVEAKIVHQTLNLAPLRSAGVPKAAIDLIRALTAKDPSVRPSSCRDVAAALERILTNSGITRSYDKRKLGIAGAALALVAASVIAIRVPSSNAPASSQTEAPLAPIASEPAQDRTRTVTPAAIVQKSPVNDAPGAVNRTPAPRVREPILDPDPPQLEDRQVAAAPIAIPAPTLALPPPPARDITPEPDTREIRRNAIRNEWIAIQQSRNPKAIREFSSKYADDPFAVKASNLAAQLELREKAALEIQSTLAEYAAAFGARNIERVAAVRELNSEVRARIARQFDFARSITMRLQPGQPEFGEAVNPDASGADTAPRTARVRFKVRIQITAKNGDVPPAADETLTATLRRDGETWKIVNLD